MTYAEDVSTRPDGTLTNKEQKKRTNRALQEIVDIAWHMPVREEVLVEIENGMSIASLKGKNLDAMTVSVLAQVNKAMAGDRDAFIALAKYGGYEPIQKAEVSCVTPIFNYNFKDEDDDKVLTNEELLLRARNITPKEENDEKIIETVIE